jgi:hypothetical protein
LEIGVWPGVKRDAGKGLRRVWEGREREGKGKGKGQGRAGKGKREGKGAGKGRKEGRQIVIKYNWLSSTNDY